MEKRTQGARMSRPSHSFLTAAVIVAVATVLTQVVQGGSPAPQATAAPQTAAPAAPRPAPPPPAPPPGAPTTPPGSGPRSARWCFWWWTRSDDERGDRLF